MSSLYLKYLKIAVLLIREKWLTIFVYKNWKKLRQQSYPYCHSKACRLWMESNLIQSSHHQTALAYQIKYIQAAVVWTALKTRTQEAVPKCTHTPCLEKLNSLFSSCSPIATGRSSAETCALFRMSLLHVMLSKLLLCLVVVLAVQMYGMAKPLADSIGATVVKVGTTTTTTTEMVCLYGFERVNGTCKEIFWLKVSQPLLNEKKNSLKDLWPIFS